MSNRRPLKVLLLAAGCDATDVSEAWSSFQWVRGLAERHDVTLLTYRKRNRPSAVPQLPDARVIEWSDLPFLTGVDYFNSALKPGFFSFYFKARRWIRKALASGERFDLIQQISPLALRYPCPGLGLGIPVIHGPIGGSLPTPYAFRCEVGNEPWYAKLRGFDSWRIKHDPWLRRTFTQAEVVIGVAPYVRELLAGVPLKRFEIMSETGVLALPPLRTDHRRDSQDLRLLFVGRVMRRKGVRDAVRALAHLKDLPQIRLDVVGDGPDLPECRNEVQRLGVADKVCFHGRKPRSDCDRFYKRANMFVFPSIREPSGNVIFESLGFGLPVITSNQGGPGYVVNETCGIRVPITDPEDYAQRIAAAIRTLARDAILVERLSVGARRRVAEIGLWDAKIAWLSDLYYDVLGRRAKTTRLSDKARLSFTKAPPLRHLSGPAC